MTPQTIITALALAAAAGCVCNAHCENDFEDACHARGGQLRTGHGVQQCVAADGGVVGTWALDEDAGGDQP
jgi:hypothetical protein